MDARDPSLEAFRKRLQEFAENYRSQQESLKDEASKSENIVRNDNIYQNIGSMVRETRLACNLTQAALAEKSGISQANISRIEAGAGHPSLRVIAKLSDAMGKHLIITIV